MLTKIMWNIVIEKDRNKKEEKTRTFYIAAFTPKGCTACIPTYLSPLKSESSACFWIKGIVLKQDIGYNEKEEKLRKDVSLCIIWILIRQ